MLIVGLGNPGVKYKFTRHNIGFLAVDYIADKAVIPLNKKTHKAVWGKGVISGKDVVIAKPQTFMNLSGISVKSLSNFYHTAVENIIVIYDDIDLGFGTVRIRKKGGSGGHRGMESIIEQLRTKDFPRIRIGIGRSQEKESKSQRVKESGNIADYVLSPFSSEEADKLPEIFDRTNEAVEVILKHGIEKAMNRFNK